MKSKRHKPRAPRIRSNLVCIRYVGGTVARMTRNAAFETVSARLGHYISKTEYRKARKEVQ